LENYTKYALKTESELKSVLAAVDDLFIVTCNKCFHEYNTDAAPELEAFTKLAESMGKNITGSTRLDFLCNKIQTGKKLALPEGTACVFVISCGLGVQTVAELCNVPVFAACDSLNYRGHHGMALTQKACDACAQCYLTMTGGICPIVDCSKGLVNGQCGGAKNGMCEVDPGMECGWERIQRRLAQIGRLDVLKAPVQVRNYAPDAE
jgi:electron transport complex protein RnfC